MKNWKLNLMTSKNVGSESFNVKTLNLLIIDKWWTKVIRVKFYDK